MAGFFLTYTPTGSLYEQKHTPEFNHKAYLNKQW